jgi:hypothetical protein
MKLSYRTLSFVVMSVLIGFSVFYYVTINRAARSVPSYGQGASLGPEYFPNGLAVLLVVLCLLALVRTVRMEDRTLEIPYAGLIALAIGATAAFIAGWGLLGAFYPIAFLFVAGLLFGFRVGPTGRVLTAATSLGMALVVTIVIYLIFDLLMSLRF